MVNWQKVVIVPSMKENESKVLSQQKFCHAFFNIYLSIIIMGIPFFTCKHDEFVFYSKVAVNRNILYHIL